MAKRHSVFAARAIFPLESAWVTGTSSIREEEESVPNEASRLHQRHERMRRSRDRTKRVLHATLVAVAVTALVFLVLVLYGLADNR